MPVAGIVVALFAAAASVSATALTASLLAGRYSPLHLGLLYLPELGGRGPHRGRARRRAQQARDPLPAAGRDGVPGGRDRGVPRPSFRPSQAPRCVGSGLTGIGLGATVAPALFVAGFSLPSANLQRVFAIVELLRAVAAFMIAPIFAHFAVTVGGSTRTGTGIALWIGLGLALGGAAIAVVPLRARRRAAADAAARPLPGRRGARVVLAAAAGRASAARASERRSG